MCTAPKTQKILRFLSSGFKYRSFLYESKKPLANKWVVVWSSGVPESGGFLKIDFPYD